MRKPNPGKTRFQFTALTGLDFDSCTRSAEPEAPAAEQDLTPALEASIARAREMKIRPFPGRQHIEGICECDYDCDGSGYFESSTDPRCAALRERAR